MKKILKKRSGFTLIEMILVLGILALTLLLTTPKMVRSYEHWEQQRFFKRLEQEWNGSLTYARAIDHRVFVQFIPTRQVVSFQTKNNGQAYTNLKLPHSLRMGIGNEGEKDWQITQDGITSPGTITFYDRRTEERYEMRIQMGGEPLNWSICHRQRLRQPGMMAANQLLALGIISVALAFLAVNVQALKTQRYQMEQAVIVNRLAKEASQEIRDGQNQVILTRAGYTALGTKAGVQVKQGAKVILEVRP